MYTGMMSDKLKRIVDWMIEYFTKNDVRGVVLGLSGGKDSTVVAMLAKLVFGDNVVAVMMPNGKQKDINDSIAIAKQIGVRTMTVNINKAFKGLIKECEQEKIVDDKLVKTQVEISEKAKTNIAPRLRMTTLYGIAQSLGYLVIGTGNYSESMVGWTTKFGDSACDFNPIGHLTCTEVVEIGKELAQIFELDEKYIVKKPADGLTAKTDEDNLGFTYKELDNYLSEGKEGPNIEKIKNMIKWSEHKRKMPETINRTMNVKKGD